VEHYTEVFVGLDVAKLRHAAAIAEAGREGEVRFFGEIGADTESVRRLVGKLEKRHSPLHFCYEAGPTGYGLHRQLTKLGHQCTVVAPSLIPRRPGDRVKTNRRDATQLARLLRAGELTAVWVPDEAHEAMRDLMRTREMAVDDLRRKRQTISSMMLRQGRIFTGKKTWGARHTQWLQAQRFEHPAPSADPPGAIAGGQACRGEAGKNSGRDGGIPASMVARACRRSDAGAARH
jgi:transposase